jgi:hypothetical protein
LVLGSLGLSKLEALEGNSHCHKNHGHRRSGKHEHPATTESSDNQRDNDSIYQTPALVGDVDARFSEFGGVPHQLEQEILVVREQSVTTHLRKETEEARNENTTSHTSRADHVFPRATGVFHLEFNSRSDLCHLGLYEDGGWVAFGVVFC